ncbi:18290_t:CDS:2, partial [Racocetra persica]
NILGAIISAKWSKGAKRIHNSNNERYYIRSGPCAIVLKKFMKQSSLLTEEQFQDRSGCCLYGITQNPSTLEYMFVESTFLCSSCLHKKQLQDRSDCCCLYGITQDPSTLEYMFFPEWISYDSLTEIKSIGKGGFGNIYSAKWDKGIKCFAVIDGNKYYTRSDPCTVALKQLKGEKDSIHLFLKEIQAQFNCCHLYGVTKDPSTSQYMFVMRYAPQGDLRRFLQKNFDKLTLESKLSIAQSICMELQNIHAKGWVHGDLHCGNILLLNEKDAFISDFGLCRPINETKMHEKKFYGVIPNIAPEIFRLQSPYSQAGDIYSLGIILWELACGLPAFSNRSHCANLIMDICNGLRPKICHFAPPTYNDLLRRCWDQNPSERPTISEVLNSINPLCICFRYNYDSIQNITVDERQYWTTRKKFKFVSLSGYIEELTLDEYGSKYKEVNRWRNSSLKRDLINSHNATMTYNIMKWKPDIPIHPNAVYKSRMISISNEYMTRQNDMTLRYEISDILS